MRRARFGLLLICMSVLLSCSSCPPAPGPDGPGPGAAGDQITVGSFNLQVFGPTKAGNAAVVSVIAQIIRHYDVIAVQEIRDASGAAIVTLKDAVNANGDHYDYEVGPREGRTSSKEQYAFFCNTTTIESLDSAYVFSEGATDTFEREPYFARFKAKGKAFDFTLVDIHTKPDDATAEISRLPEAMTDATTRTGEADVICLGDFNADGSYFSEGSYSTVFPSSSYSWLIDNSVDTTVASSSNTYDRIVTSKTCNEDFAGTAGVYQYDQVITMGSLTPGDISDHFPVQAVFWTGKDSD